MLAELKVSELLEKTASGDPVPGGGSMAALGAAIAAGLTEMVANLTIGKKGFESVEAQMTAVVENIRPLREKLAKAMDRDAEAYNEVLSAFKLPKSTEEENETRQEAIQEGLKHAALVPLEVAEDGLRIMEFAGTVVAKGNPNAVTDGAVAAMMARTAVLSAVYNVKINLGSIRDKVFVDKIIKTARQLADKAVEAEREILSQIEL